MESVCGGDERGLRPELRKAPRILRRRVPNCANARTSSLTVADVAFHQHAKKPSAVDAFGLRRSRPLYGDAGGFAAADESFESDESDDAALGAAAAGGRARRPTDAASSATGTVHATSSVERRSGAPQQRRRSSGGQYLREAPSSVRCSPAGERFTSSSATSHDVVAPGSPAVAGESGESEAATRAREAEDCMLGYIAQLMRAAELLSTTDAAERPGSERRSLAGTTDRSSSSASARSRPARTRSGSATLAVAPAAVRLSSPPST